MICYSKNSAWWKSFTRFLAYVFPVYAIIQMFEEQIMNNTDIFRITVNTKVTKSNHIEELFL